MVIDVKLLYFTNCTKVENDIDMSATKFVLLLQVTMKKLEKLNAPVNDKNKEALIVERIDQVRVNGFQSFNYQKTT